MTRIIIAGDSWGTHSYEKSYIYKNLEGFKWTPKKTYVLYPGPGHFLSDLTTLEVITTANHGDSNTEAFNNLNKINYQNDIIVFYKTGLLREVYKAYLNKKQVYSTKNCKEDFEYYSDIFYKRCSNIMAKYFCLIGGCVEIQTEQAKQYNIDVIEPSITKWMFPDFKDNDFDPTLYWLEYQYSCEHFKQGIIQSHDKIEFWDNHPKMFIKKHPTVDSNRKIAKRIYDYLKDKNIL